MEVDEEVVAAAETSAVDEDVVEESVLVADEVSVLVDVGVGLEVGVGVGVELALEVAADEEHAWPTW